MRRVLIVEDDKLLASQIKEMIEFQGFDAEIAFTGPDGISAFAREPADLILVAVMLPGVHGIRVLETIRAMPDGVTTPAFLMSAVYRTAKMFAADMERLKVLDFLSKPFSLNELGTRIEKLLLGVESGFFPAISGPDPGLVHLAEGLEAADASQSDLWETPSDSWTGAPENSFLATDAARHLVTGGELSAERWVQALTTLFHSHSSGRLQVESAGGTKVIYFLNGYPVWVQVPADGPGLAHWLVDEQILTDADLTRVTTAMAENSWSTRRALMELSLLSTPDLPPLMEGWVAKQVQSGLSESGRFEFSSSDDFAARIPVYEVNPIRVLWEGLCPALSRAKAERDLDSLGGSWVGKTPTFPKLFGYFSGSGMADLSDFLNTRRSLREVRSRYSDSAGNTSRCLWMMHHASLIGFTEAPPDMPNRPSAIAPPPKTQAAKAKAPDGQTRRYGPDTLERLRNAGTSSPRRGAGAKHIDNAIIRDYLAKIDEDHYAFLGVSRLATVAEVRSAYDLLAARYRTAGTSIQGESRGKAKELLAHLVGAFEELRDPVRRRNYDEALRRKTLGIEVHSDPFLDEAGISGFEIPSLSEIWEGDEVKSAESVNAARMFNDRAGSPQIMSQSRMDPPAENLGSQGPAWANARRHMMTGHWKRAYSVLDELRQELADDPTVLAGLGWCRFVLADGESDSIRTALEWADLALTFAPRHRAGAEVRARILCRSGTDATQEERVRSLKRLLQLSPGLPWAEIQLRRSENSTTKIDERDRSSGLRGLFRRKK